MTLALHQNAFVPTLEDMTDTIVASVQPFLGSIGEPMYHDTRDLTPFFFPPSRAYRAVALIDRDRDIPRRGHVKLPGSSVAGRYAPAAEVDERGL